MRCLFCFPSSLCLACQREKDGRGHIFKLFIHTPRTNGRFSLLSWSLRSSLPPLSSDPRASSTQDRWCLVLFGDQGQATSLPAFLVGSGCMLCLLSLLGGPDINHRGLRCCCCHRSLCLLLTGPVAVGRDGPLSSFLLTSRKIIDAS